MVSKKVNRTDKSLNHSLQLQPWLPTSKTLREGIEAIRNTMAGASKEISICTQTDDDAQKCIEQTTSADDKSHKVSTNREGKEETEIGDLLKSIESAHRYLQIAFAEDLYLYCHGNNINFAELRAALNTKWNVNILDPGEGIVGHLLRSGRDSKTLLNPTAEFRGSKIIDAVFDVDYEYRKAKKK